MKKLLTLSAFALSALLSVSCIFQDETQVTATVQAFGSNTAGFRYVALTVLEGTGRAKCLSDSTPSGVDTNSSGSGYHEATLIQFDSTVLKLEDLHAGDHEGVASNSRDMFYTTYMAQVRVTGVTATRIEGKFQLRDDQGVTRKGWLGFQAIKCPDYNTTSGLARPFGR